jgi:mRNA interferase MazF
MVEIRQGDLFWIDLDDPQASEPGYRHAYVVVQNNLFNQSRIRTVIVCALTSNVKRAVAPGNVLLDPGEGNLPKQSIVNVSQVYTVDKSFLDDKIGTLSMKRVRQILNGILLVLEPRD